MTIPIRSIWIDEEMREAMTEYAWLHRTTKAAVVRAAVENVRDHPADESVLSEDDALSRVNMNVKIQDDLWLAAKDAAHSVGKSVNSLIRRRIRKLLKDEGLIE